MLRLSRVEREAFWRDLISQRQASQLTVAKVCHQAGVCVASYYQWQKKLRSGKRPAVSKSQPSSPLVPVRIVDDRTSELIVELPGDIRIRVPQNCESACLQRILRSALAVCQEDEAC